MIFNTITNDLNGAINKIGIFNRSFADLKNAISANGLKGLFNSISPAITSNDLALIKEYNRLVGVEGVSSQSAWYRTMLSSSRSAQALFDDENNLIRTNNGLILSEEALTRATNTMTIGAKVGQVALRGLSIAGNMLAMWGISVAIQTAVKWIDKFVHSAEYAEKAIKAATDSAKSFSDSIKDIQKETVDMEKSIDSIIDRYAKLSQGVNTFTNENISLPTDQYEEFLGLNKQLTELFPSLTRNYDENGNAILGLSGSVDSVTESIRSLVEQEKELARAQIRENLEQYFEGTDEADGAWKALEGRKQKLEEANEALTTLKNTYEGLINADTSTVVGQYHKNFAGKEQAKYIEYIKDNFGEDIAKAMEDAVSIHLGKGLNGQFADLVVDFSKLELTETQKEQIVRSYDTFYSELLAKQKTAMSEFESQNSEFSNNAMLWLEDLSFYKDNDKYTQTAIQNLVRNIDWSNYNFEELDYEGVKRILQDSVLTPFQIACEDPSTKKSLDDALKGLFTMDTSDMSVGDITSQVDSYINTIATAIGEDPKELKIKFGFDATDTLPLINNVKEKLQDDFADRVGELKIDELQIAAGLEIPNNTLLSWDELITKIKEVQNSTANENPISLSDLLSTEDLSDTKKELLEHAKSGELTPDTFTSTKEYMSLLEKTGLTAKQACDEIKKLPEFDMDMSDWQTQLQNARSNVSELKGMLDELTSKDSKGLSTSSVDKIISDYPKLLGYLNDTPRLIEEINNLISQQSDIANDAGSMIIEYSSDAYEQVKLSAQDAFEQVTTMQNGQIQSVAEMYGIDLNNYTNLAQAKKAIEFALLGDLNQGWADHFGIVVDSLTGMTKATENMGEYYNNSENQKKVADYNNLIKQLNDARDRFNSNINYGSAGVDKSKSGSKKKEEDKWLEEYKKKLAELQNLLAKGRLMPSSTVMWNV